MRLAADTEQDTYARDIPLALIFFFYLRRHLDEWLSTGAVALAAARRIGDRGGEGRALSSLGNAYSEMRQWDIARNFFQQTLAICEAEHDRSREARTLTNLGNISYALHAYEEGLAYYHKSLAIYQEIGESYSEGQTWNNIGYIYSSMERHDDAIDCYEHSLAIFREIGEIHGQGAVLTNIGARYQVLRRSDEAINCHRHISREHDEMLNRVVRAATDGQSGIAVLVGGSSTGKTRACWASAPSFRPLTGPNPPGSSPSPPSAGRPADGHSSRSNTRGLSNSHCPGQPSDSRDRVLTIRGSPVTVFSRPGW